MSLGIILFAVAVVLISIWIKIKPPTSVPPKKVQQITTYEPLLFEHLVGTFVDEGGIAPVPKTAKTAFKVAKKVWLNNIENSNTFI